MMKLVYMIIGLSIIHSHNVDGASIALAQPSVSRSRLVPLTIRIPQPHADDRSLNHLVRMSLRVPGLQHSPLSPGMVAPLSSVVNKHASNFILQKTFTSDFKRKFSKEEN